MLAVGALCDKLKKTEPYKSELEHMLVQHIFPEFSSPAGHLRAKVFIVFGLNLCNRTSTIHGCHNRGSVVFLNLFENSVLL